MRGTRPSSRYRQPAAASLSGDDRALTAPAAAKALTCARNRVNSKWRIAGASHTELAGLSSFLSGADSAQATFTVPKRRDVTDRSALDDGNWIDFELTVTDGDEESASDTVRLTIRGSTWQEVFVSVADADAEESSGRIDFVVTLDTAGRDALSVDWATADGTATAGNDFTAATGTLTFSAVRRTWGKAARPRDAPGAPNACRFVASSGTFSVDPSNATRRRPRYHDPRVAKSATGPTRARAARNASNGADPKRVLAREIDDFPDTRSVASDDTHRSPSIRQRSTSRADTDRNNPNATT